MIGYYEISDTIPPLEKIEALANALSIKPSQLLDDNTSSNQRETDLYRILNKRIRKNQLEKESSEANK